jgi:VanZ family protein
VTRILLIVIALIIYGSLYPFQLRAPVSPNGPVWMFFHAWPNKLGHGDIGDTVVNLLVYLPVGMFGFLALERQGERRLRWILPVLLSFTLSCSMEFLQIFDTTRVCSLLDLLNNTIGGLIGVLLGARFRRSMTGPVLLILYWIGFQLCALFAMVASQRARPGFLHSPIEAVTVLLAWIVVFRLYTARDALPHESWQSTALAVAFTALLIVRGLAPFHFQVTHARFDWMPFNAMFRADWIVGLPVFLEKSFYYGAAIWLWRLAGWKLERATIFIAAILAAIEAIQLYLPGRTSEITDPLLAILLGFMLWLLEQDFLHVSRPAIIRMQT